MSIALPTSFAFSAPYRTSTSFRANSRAVAGPLDVTVRKAKKNLTTRGKVYIYISIYESIYMTFTPRAICLLL